jgi:hypothetical protein
MVDSLNDWGLSTNICQYCNTDKGLCKICNKMEILHADLQATQHAYDLYEGHLSATMLQQCVNHMEYLVDAYTISCPYTEDKQM